MKRSEFLAPKVISDHGILGIQHSQIHYHVVDIVRNARVARNVSAGSLRSKELIFRKATRFFFPASQRSSAQNEIFLCSVIVRILLQLLGMLC